YRPGRRAGRSFQPWFESISGCEDRSEAGWGRWGAAWLARTSGMRVNDLVRLLFREDQLAFAGAAEGVDLALVPDAELARLAEQRGAVDDTPARWPGDGRTLALVRSGTRRLRLRHVYGVPSCGLLRQTGRS